MYEREYEINGREFVIPEITLEMDEKLLEFFGQFITEKGFEIDEILNMVTKKRAHRELVTMLLIPKKMKWWEKLLRRDRSDYWKDLRNMTNNQLLDVISYFFGESGPLQSVTRIFSGDNEVLDLTRLKDVQKQS